jgi:nicotinamide-nucleotide amidase
MLAEMLVGFEASLPERIKLAYLPNFGMVKLRLTVREESQAAAEDLVQPFFENLQNLVKDYLVATEDIGLEVVVGRLLQERNQTMATAESCTGGYIAHLLTSRPGASAWFKGGMVSYANESKEKLLGVLPETIGEQGAVSEATVREMVAGALRVMNTDYALAVSGIMGPEGGTPEKPVGTVWMAAGNRDEIRTRQLQFRFDRQRNITQTATWALDWLRRLILDTNKG